MRNAVCFRRAGLLAGASIVALLVAGSGADARNILSGGPASPVAPVVSGQAAVNAAAQEAARRGRDSLSRTTQALQAMRAAQSAARDAAAAIRSTVPNGLGVGGLKPVANPNSTTDGLTDWINAEAPKQVVEDGRYNVTIKQTDGRAILSWDTFNIGSETTLTFDQQGNADWVALNRVVGQIDPATGRRDASKAPAPSQILGSIKADGTVLVINQNGILFSGTAQVDTHSLVASTLEIGRAYDVGRVDPRTIADRNAEFLASGLLGYNDTSVQDGATFSAQRIGIDGTTRNEENIEGSVIVEAGARLKAGADGLIMLTGPRVVNNGHLTAAGGQVVLQSGREVLLRRSEGTAASLDPNIRGVVATSVRNLGDPDDYVLNTETGLIEADRGNITLGGFSAVINEGMLSSTTSVSRNGSIVLSAADVKLAPGAILAIEADAGTDVIPQDADSIAAFKSSSIFIGNRNGYGGTGFDPSARIEIGRDALIHAPGADVSIGAISGATGADDRQGQGQSRVFIDTGATIDVAGLKDVLVPLSRNVLEIGPLKGNELANSPLLRNSFLNGETVYVDPRLSGVRDDGVAWIGSPLIDAASYYAQVGVGVAELMTTGGTVTLGAQGFAGTGDGALAGDVAVKAGAIIDVSGGWLRYEGGRVQTTRLVTADGTIVDIGDADPDTIYAGIYKGFTLDQGRWGTGGSWVSPLTAGGRTVAEFTEGRDAGALVVKASAIAFDGDFHGEAFAGSRQRQSATVGTAAGTLFGDSRHLQASASQLPSGAFLYFQLLTTTTGGADVAIVADADDGDLAAGFGYGQSVSVGADGSLIRRTRSPSSLLPEARRETMEISDSLLSDSGAAQVSIHTSGSITVESDARVDLIAGGIFDALAGRTLTVAGDITAAGGLISLETFNSRGLSEHVWGGSAFGDKAVGDTLGDYDILVSGNLSTRGRWVNDLGQFTTGGEGGAWLDGGSISLYAAPNLAAAFDRDGHRLTQAAYADPEDANAPRKATDISGSIIVDRKATLDVTGGGRVRPDGSLDLSATGGDIALVSETTYAQISTTTSGRAGGLSGFRGGGLAFTDSSGNETAYVPLNPDRINAKVVFDPASILANGFAGGGSFTLTAPGIAFGETAAAGVTALSLDFFTTAGFGAYNLTSYKTALLANDFADGYGGANAVLATQTLSIGAGETLNLSQSLFPAYPDAGLASRLAALETGGDLYRIVSAAVPDEAYDRKAVNLTLGGLLELHVAEGGRIIGEAGAHLTVPKLLNEGSIVLHGGRITQSEVMPLIYGGDGLAHGVHDLSEAFAYNDAGRIEAGDLNTLGITNEDGALLTNGELAGSHALYLLGLLGEGEGIRLAEGSVTDLSGTIILDPRAALDGDRRMIRDGRVIAGGTIEALASHALAGLPFRANQDLLGELGVDNGVRYGLLRAERSIAVDGGARLDLSGVSGQLDQRTGTGNILSGRGYALTEVWSEGGTLSAPGGLILDRAAEIDATGGDARALGGTLEVSDLVLTEQASTTATADTLSADQIEAAGFDTLRVFGSVTGKGDVSLSLRRAFLLESRDYAVDPRFDISDAAVRDLYLPRISSLGGKLLVEAGYVGFGSGLFDTVSAPVEGRGLGSVTFHATAIDVTGALVVDGSVSSLRLEADEDLRLIGARSWQALLPTNETIPTTLRGHIAAAGNLTLVAGRIYPTTGTDFAITSSAANGKISFGRKGEVSQAPLSAGASLTVQAANISQGGALFAPFGTITLGSHQPYVTGGTDGEPESTFAPATTSVTLAPGSITSVSAGGQSIPYGTTTDGTEWYFAPTGSDPLSAAPTGTLHIAGDAIDLAEGSSIDLSGGGDVFAYEFVPGTGGSHDVLSRLNADASTGNAGLQYPDGRQVYAIVPGLSEATVAAYDPIYAADYDLASGSGVGKRVWLDAAPGLAAGWYTLLPARYALLPGGMRVVERTEATSVAAGTGLATPDGTLAVSGRYGDALSGTQSSTVHLFDVTPRETVLSQSRYTITEGNDYFADAATRDNATVPRRGIDAGRLVLDPTARLIIEAAVDARAEAGGRAAQIDIGGSDILVTAGPVDGGASDGIVRLSADRLSAFGAGSLLIGGIRTDRADGTTAVQVTANSITIANDAAHPLSASDVVLIADDGISVRDGASILAAGSGDGGTGAFVVGDGEGGAFLRVANGGERLVTRLRGEGTGPLTGAMVSVGAAYLAGDAVAIDSAGDLDIASRAAIAAKALAIGAGTVTFSDAATGIDGLVVTPALLARFAAAGQLTIRADQGIAFDDGHYDLGTLRLDAPALIAREGGLVTLGSDALTLSNETGATLSACAADCGDARLSIDTGSLTIGNGAIRTLGFEDGGVDIVADTGIFGGGDGRLDVGDADLSIQTSYIGDAASGVSAMTLASGGRVTITGGGTAAPAGTAGSSLTVIGKTIEVTGATLRATAGTLRLEAEDGITLGAGSVVATPGYDQTFGDATDPVKQAAPAGSLSLVTAGGDIDLGAGSLVSVGGGAGAAGRLTLSAAAGAVDFGGTLDGTGRTSGGSFSLDSLGGFDLALLAANVGARGFDGAFDIRTRTGDLSLRAGETLTASSVSLTADGGRVAIAGTIDTSGISGGDVGLFGRDGVALADGARIDASAEGYGAGDSRQASGGDVLLATQGDGTISIARGAVIDVSAENGADRVVDITRDGTTYAQAVAGDRGGTITIRSPLIEAPGADTVKVSLADADSLVGAREIVLEAYKRWDLGEVAASGDYAGVILDEATNTITLDVSEDLDPAKANGTRNPLRRVNFLGDEGEGTLVSFVQDFDISAANGDLGGLVASDNFHARPGIELAFDGNVTLASSWNLGAGTVDVTGALAAGLMTRLGGGVSAVVPGAEAEIFAGYTSMVYRTGGGDVRGEAPAITFRAGGDLRLDGSLTEGYFSYSAPVLVTSDAGEGDGSGEPYQFAFQRFGGLDSLGLYYYVYGFNALASGAPYTILGGDGGGGGGGATISLGYDPAANGADAKTGVDTLSYMVAFPSLCGTLDCGAAATSSYSLVAGSRLDSADPRALRGGATASITFNPYRSYAGIEASAAAGPVEIDLYFDVGNNDLFLGSAFPDEESHFVAGSELAEALGADTVLEIDLSWDTADDASGIQSRDAWAAFLDALDNGTDPELAALIERYGAPDVYGDGYLSGAAAVLQYWVVNYMAEAVAADLPAYFTAFGLPSPFGGGGGGGGGEGGIAPGLARNVVRTGGGSIRLDATGDIDLYDRTQALPTYVGADGASYSLGGAAIYTTGHDAEAAASAGRYLTGGGDITLRALGSIRGSRIEGTKSGQSWLTGAVGTNTDLAVATPGLDGFTDGIATLGGGTLSVFAGADLVDLNLVAGGSARTVTGDDGVKTLVTFGGGDLLAQAGNDILGGLFDIWSGRAVIGAGGDIVADGTVAAPDAAGRIRAIEDSLGLRLFDATIEVSAPGDIALQGIASVAADGPGASGTYLLDEVNAYGFTTERASVELVAGGDLRFVNSADFTLVSDLQPSASFNAVWPARVSAVSLRGDIDVAGEAGAVLMMPGATGNLDLLAGGSILGASIAMLDADPGLLPGYFSEFALQGAVLGQGLAFRFPAVFSSTSDSERTRQHNGAITHAGDERPVRIAAGLDIGGTGGGLILSVAEQARIAAGRDIVNMMFFGQNVAVSDITRITAGRDITATTRLVAPASGFEGPETILADLRPAVLGNTFVIGGPGSFVIEAGRDLGPFLNSADITAIRNIGDAKLAAVTETYGGGILSVGNEWNPYLAETGADVSVLFGVAGGADFDALRDYYVDPAKVAALPDELVTEGGVPLHAASLVTWMKAHRPADLLAAYGRVDVTAEEAYAVFVALPDLDQRPFLTGLFFDELEAFANPESPSFGESARGYAAISRLFPADRGYTANGEAEDDFASVRDLLTLKGYGADLAAGLDRLADDGYTVTVGTDDFTAQLVDGIYRKLEDGALVTLSAAEQTAFNAQVLDALATGKGAVDHIVARRQTGDLDLRLATLQTARGGDIAIFGPGGRVIAGSTVRTSEQAARRAYDGGRLYAGNADGANFISPFAAVIEAIPTGLEGVLTLRGGAISSFTDGDFLLNQSRLYTRAGGDITLWSSNGDLNAGQGPKTTANVPPVVVKVNQDIFVEEDRAGSTSGAGIAAYPAESGEDPDVYLIAPRGTVDAGDAGVRVSGSLFVAAQVVVNADNFQVSGASVGTPVAAVADVGGLAAASAAATAATESATAAGPGGGGNAVSDQPSIITVEVLGYGGGEACPKGVRPDGQCL
ncbi:MAG: filamentous hemagglutinin family protein [Zavarzinia sp.]|nr:filamentous hemagglutinin family protein [Zavarzinia sp.]